MQICNKIPDPVKHKKTLSKLLQSQLTTKEQDLEKNLQQKKEIAHGRENKKYMTHMSLNGKEIIKDRKKERKKEKNILRKRERKKERKNNKY